MRFTRWLFGTRVGRTNFFRIVWPNLLCLALSGVFILAWKLTGEELLWWPGVLFLVLFHTPVPVMLRNHHLGFPELLEAED